MGNFIGTAPNQVPTNGMLGTAAFVDVQQLRRDVHVDDFGAVGNGATNDTPAFQRAIDQVFAAGGGTVRFTRKHLIDTALTVKDYVSLRGPFEMPDELLPANAASYGDQAGQLIINSGVTVTVQDAASVSHALIMRKGLTLPFADATAATTGVAAFAGTAFTVGGAGAYFHHMLILGFNQAIYSTNRERVRIEYVQGDCNNGIDLRTAYDICYVDKCHFWPFTTTHQSWTTDTLLTRPGCAYRFKDIGDWSKFTSCFSYGYTLAYDVDSCDHVSLIGCGADYPTGLTTSHVGFQLKGTSLNTALVRCQAAAQGTAVEVNTTSGMGGVVQIMGCDFWDNDVQCISVVNGRAIITGNTMRGTAGAGVVIGAGASGCVVTSNYVDGLPTPFNINATPAANSIIDNNLCFNCSGTHCEKTFSE